jgi:hypothetical protein
MVSRYPEVNKIFDDLDVYRAFCVEFGYVFNESHLYVPKTQTGYLTPFSQFERYRKGQRIANNWKEDRRAFLASQRN